MGVDRMHLPRTVRAKVYREGWGVSRMPQRQRYTRTKKFPTVIRTTLKWARLGLLTIFLTYLILLAGFSEFNPSPVDLAVYPYKYSILDWELANVPDRWTHKIAAILPGGSNQTREEKVAQVKEFFDLGNELRQLEEQMLIMDSISGPERLPPGEHASPTKRTTIITDRRQSLHADVEDTIETEITRILKQEKLSSSIGVFPPVDVVFTNSPHLIILSPRSKIERKEDILLNPGLSISEKESIEREISLAKRDLSVYIEDTGGVAVYPSVVTDTSGLQSATEITSHEWIHHWLLFRPLGRNFWSGAEMASLNETVASLAGQELGDKVFTSLTGEVINRSRPLTATTDKPEDFDFRSEMRQTRLQAEAYLAAGKIAEAEAYMDDRRRLFVAHQYPIRKLNQAYFAFHGTYAASAASISPIGDQVQELRDHSDSLANFLRTASGFGTYQKFLDHLNTLPDIQEESAR